MIDSRRIKIGIFNHWCYKFDTCIWNSKMRCNIKTVAKSTFIEISNENNIKFDLNLVFLCHWEIPVRSFWGASAPKISAWIRPGYDLRWGPKLQLFLLTLRSLSQLRQCLDFRTNSDKKLNVRMIFQLSDKASEIRTFFRFLSEYSATWQPCYQASFFRILKVNERQRGAVRNQSCVNDRYY